MYRTTELSLGRMLLGLLVLLLLSGFTTAHPAKRNETADPMEGYCPKDTTYGINVFENSSDPTGPMKNCDCLDDPWVPPPSSLPFPQKRSTSNADAAAVKDPSFLDSLIQQGSDIMANITWGYGDLAFNVSVLIQNPGCTGGDYSDIANCASGLFWVQFDRPLGPEKCPVPDGGLKVSKQQWNDWANAAKGSCKWGWYGFGGRFKVTIELVPQNMNSVLYAYFAGKVQNGVAVQNGIAVS